MSDLPGLKIGPLDPDQTAEFGQVAAQNKAKTLLRSHAQMHPVALTRQLARPLDGPRTKALVRDEVVKYVGKLRREDGDPVLPDDAELAGAAVRGQPDRPQVLTFTYTTKSGRIGKWFAPYDRDKLPDSAESGDELSQVEEMRERGFVFGGTGAEAEIQRRTAARLRRQVEALRAQAEGKDVTVDDEGDEHYADTRADVRIVDDNQALRREVEELRSRLALAEGALDDQAKRQMRETAAEEAERSRTRTRTEQPEPVEGYGDLNAEDAKKLLRSDDTDEETRERILAYERSHSNRKSVVQAGEAARDS